MNEETGQLLDIGGETYSFDDLVGISTAAASLSISESSVRRLVKENQLPFYRIRNRIRLNIKDLVEYAESCRVEVDATH